MDGWMDGWMNASLFTKWLYYHHYYYHIRVFTCPANLMNTEIVEMNDLTASANTILNIVNVKVIGHIDR